MCPILAAHAECQIGVAPQQIEIADLRLKLCIVLVPKAEYTVAPGLETLTFIISSKYKEGGALGGLGLTRNEVI